MTGSVKNAMEYENRLDQSVSRPQISRTILCFDTYNFKYQTVRDVIRPGGSLWQVKKVF
jgi:hypothetical protein